MRRLIVYNNSKGFVFRSSYNFFLEKRVVIHTSLSDLYLDLNDEEEETDIIFLSHGFIEIGLDDDVGACFLKGCKSKVSSILKLLNIFGQKKLRTVTFIACNTRHVNSPLNNIKQIISYEGFILEEDLLKFSKKVYNNIHLNDNIENGYLSFMSAIKNNTILSTNDFKRTPEFCTINEI